MKRKKALEIMLKETEKEIGKFGDKFNDENFGDILLKSLTTKYDSNMSQETIYKELGKLNMRATCPKKINDLDYYDTIIKKYDELMPFIEFKMAKFFAEQFKDCVKEKKEVLMNPDKYPMVYPEEYLKLN